MDIIYVGKDVVKREVVLQSHGDVILLLFDKWDDYDYKTSFPTYCRINGQIVELPTVKILIEDQATSFSYLDSLVSNGWNGIFPIPEVHYVSNPEDITFYEQIDGHLSLEAAVEVAKVLRDASYMVHIAEDEDSLELVQTEGFRKSLQRERGSVKAFLDGWRFLSRQGISIGNLTFRFRTSAGDIQPLKLNFAADTPLPHDINVLIGPNGVGKSRALIQLVEDWLRLDLDEKVETGFEVDPNINQMVVVSYSPFELFPLDSEATDKKAGAERKDHGVYRYFGLRTYETRKDEAGNEYRVVRLSRRWPNQNAACSLISCLEDDRKYGAIKSWSAKIKTLYSVLGIAIDFDELAVGVSGYGDKKQLFDGELLFNGAIVVVDNRVDGDGLPDAYIPIRVSRLDEPNTKKLCEFLHHQSGIVFLKGGRPVALSSGQRLFSYIVANIVGAMRRNSLVLIDEPELFLHPTLEIAFIQMLKEILENYGSKALLATHSLVTVRELPRDCVHVFERTEDGVFIKHPPFETFGGDIQRISSYVFGDKSVSKPFEAWLQKKLEEYGSAKALIRALGDNINEEMLIQIHAMAEGKW
ncbi:AAA family ATPase [Brenneria goodwinii]|uniref:EA59 gene protein n=1 Tax=Brenneria goodwinii TaxID=1109412 RepID=A0A0G4JWF1_9GAMM|nr:ATP-binding protein [Brenneria goodwinii]MCG8158605.1 AAA family ATPase [Brenneria goodwinii]MCG8162966.1 AAA family ATPase [Brenneria goodwinii]MCG8167805.1 AAA family ATPase [Brenneria goodwinii]MCG8172389.1 AAA family ATPase [Brenneria goodwinii]MCG8177021.1 AAA family ATPase [Brenneria goodwinii]